MNIRIPLPVCVMKVTVEFFSGSLVYVYNEVEFNVKNGKIDIKDILNNKYYEEINYFFEKQIMTTEIE